MINPILFILLLILHPVRGMHSSSSGINNQQSGRGSSVSFTPLCTSTGYNHAAAEKEQDKDDSKNDSYEIDFSDDAIEEMNDVFEDAPQEAKNIVRHLKDPAFLHHPDYRSAIFTGRPGTGKTAVAKAIAYKMWQEKQWKHMFVVSGDIVGKKRHQAAERLRKILASVTAQSDPMLVIIDELNLLLENTHSKHHDTDATSKVFWSFLDKQARNNDIFVIGTMNRPDKLAQPVKSRTVPTCIEFTPLEKIDRKNKIFRKKILCDGVTLHDEVTDDYLNAALQPLKNCTGRDLKGLALLSKIIYRKYDDNSALLCIQKKHISEAINQYTVMDPIFWTEFRTRFSLKIMVT